MYLQKDFTYGCSDVYNGNHDLDTSGFTCLDNIINTKILCTSIPGFECIPYRKVGFDSICVTVGISLQRRCRNIFHRDVSIDDRRNLLCRDASRDDCRNSLLRDTSRDDSRDTTVETTLQR